VLAAAGAQPQANPSARATLRRREEIDKTREHATNVRGGVNTALTPQRISI